MTKEQDQLLPGVCPHDINAREGRKTFKLTFRCWGYAAQHEVTVGGNCLAFDNLDCALGNLYDNLPLSRQDVPQLLLTDEKGDTLLCEDDEEQQTDWLAEMLVCAELVAVEAKATHSNPTGAE